MYSDGPRSLETGAPSERASTQLSFAGPLTNDVSGAWWTGGAGTIQVFENIPEMLPAASVAFTWKE